MPFMPVSMPDMVDDAIDAIDVGVADMLISISIDVVFASGGPSQQDD
jgi:hypothetical protein